MVTDRLHQWRRWAGIDRPIFFIICGRAWSLVSGPVAIYLITRFFSPEVQGYYYTFGGVMAMQVFFELGFSQCTIQFASHEFSVLRFGPDGALEGDATARARLASLARLSIKWYAYLSLLFVLAVGASGHLFFYLKNPGGDWIIPWWLLCGATGLTFALAPFWALLEGCNQVAFVYAFRTFSAILQSVVLWLSLASGAGLYACGLPVLGLALVSALVLYGRWRTFFRQLFKTKGHQAISWQKEIWPFQWRTGVTWASGYFVYNFLTPLLFYFHGPAVAGQMGMSLQLVNALHAVAVSWTYSKMPLFGILIAQRRYAELDQIFKRATTRAVGVCFLGAIVLTAGVWWLQSYYLAVGGRFLKLDALVLLLVPTISNQFLFALSFYVRAHKIEPFMRLAIVNGVATGLSALILAKQYGAFGGCLAYAGVQFSLLPWALSIWRNCKREWHSEGSPPKRTS